MAAPRLKPGIYTAYFRNGKVITITVKDSTQAKIDKWWDDLHNKQIYTSADMPYRVEYRDY